VGPKIVHALALARLALARLPRPHLHARATKPQTIHQTCLQCTVSSTYTMHTRKFRTKVCCLPLGSPTSRKHIKNVGKSEPDVSIARDKRGVGSATVLVAPTIEIQIDRASSLALAKPRREPVYCDMQVSSVFFATDVWGTAHQPAAAHTLHMYTAHVHAVCANEDTLYTNRADSHGCSCTLALW